MLTSGDVEFEPETPKIYATSNSSVVMVAGDSSLQHEILKRVIGWANQQIKEKPAEWISIGALAREYYAQYQNIKSEYAELRILRPLGLTIDSFLQRQAHMSNSVVDQVTSGMVNFDMPAIEAIVSGVDSLGAHIYVVTNGGMRCDDAIGFAAIGVGHWHANSQFMFARHNRARPLPETLLLTYAAKKRAEVAPGVGAGTDMFTLGPQLGSYALIFPEVIKSVDRIYKRTRRRSEDAIRRSNAEVNKYVEQLRRAAPAQEQKTTAARPATDQSDGEKSVGGESSGAATKPN
jgi:hypothetical protein